MVHSKQGGTLLRVTQEESIPMYFHEFPGESDRKFREKNREIHNELNEQLVSWDHKKATFSS